MAHAGPSFSRPLAGSGARRATPGALTGAGLDVCLTAMASMVDFEKPLRRRIGLERCDTLIRGLRRPHEVAHPLEHGGRAASAPDDFSTRRGVATPPRHTDSPCQN